MATLPAPLDETLNEDKLRTLIGSLDKDIDREGLEIMKLSMRCELRQDQVENATKASELCYHLIEVYERPEVVLTRIIYALEILGHRRYGYRSVRKIENAYTRPLASFDTTMLPERVNKENFLLRQYLAVACRHISEECSRHFIAICANRLHQNSKIFTTPCAVITKLIEESVVTVDNHEDYMEEIMVEANVSESQLKQYHDICRRIKKNQSQRSRASTLTEDEYAAFSTGNRHRRTIQDPGDECEQTPLLGVIMGYSGRKRFICCSMVLGVAGILFVLLCLGGLYVAERFSINQNVLLKCFDNTSVILTEVNHFVTASVMVREDTEHTGDFYHNIEVYQLSSGCSDVPGTKHSYTKSGTNLNIIETTFYALPGFSIAFNICGRTNSTIEPERLEMILSQLPHSKTIGFYFLHPGTNNTWECKKGKFTLTAPDYYSLFFLPPTHPTRFEFNVTYMVHEIDPDMLGKHSVANHTLHKDNDNETIPLTFGAIYSCFVATITHNPDTDKDVVHVQLSFTEQVYGLVVCGGVGVVTVLLLVSACAIRAATRRSREN